MLLYSRVATQLTSINDLAHRAVLKAMLCPFKKAKFTSHNASRRISVSCALAIQPCHFCLVYKGLYVFSIACSCCKFTNLALLLLVTKSFVAHLKASAYNALLFSS
jgi:hypothetical protein